MDPWYKVATLRKEVREGRSFNPDEFAIALEQVVAGNAPDDYKKPDLFFARTVFTRALRDHASLVLKRLSGRTENTASVLTLITQFGGGKTHTLATLYHLGKNGDDVAKCDGVADLIRHTGIVGIPRSKVGVFVGNSWDPQPGRESPWIDLARQIAGDAGVEALGPAAKTTPPGTDAINRVFKAAGAPVLMLFDEVLNYLNRYRDNADAFHAFIQNLTVATTGTTQSACVISLPRSQVEMTDWDQKWQDKISKVVRRVAKDLIVNDETEIGEVVRRRLFESLGSERVRKSVAKTFSDWCFERRAQLPPEWSAGMAREHLQQRFETCYPFHPATLSVFQRKWQALPQYQQTRGTLAMLAQWISIASQDAFRKARREALITLGSAPLWSSDFRSIVLGQLGESRLLAGIDTDVSGEQAHCKALDADSQGPLHEIHRRVGTAILFESSGGQSDKSAHLPELRFALGEPEIDTTSIDAAALALEARAYYIRKVGVDGFVIGYKPTLKKVVNDRRASLDEESEVVPAMRKTVEDEFKRAASIPVIPLPRDGAEIPDTPKLSLVVLDPDLEWTGNGLLRQQIAEWTRQRGKSPRLYPGALIWCLKKPGRELREKVEMALAWKRVEREVASGTLGGEFDRTDRADLATKAKDADIATKEEVWACYRYAILADGQASDGLKIIDLGAGHSSSNETLCGRVLGALKAEALLNESVGAGYLDRNWPSALKESGAWPLAGLRQCFLNGSLTRLADPDSTLRGKIVEFVNKGEFGLASQKTAAGGYVRVWLGPQEMVAPEDVAFEAEVFLLRKEIAQKAKAGKPAGQVEPSPSDAPPLPAAPPLPPPTPALEDRSVTATRVLRLSGDIPPEVWNRLGSKILPKLRAGSDLRVGLDFSVTVPARNADALAQEIRQILQELALGARMTVE